jgi:hypothetical protein
MLCKCCEGRNYWISEKELSQIHSSELQEQAMQAIELFLDGVQIGEIGQEDVFSMDDFEIATTVTKELRGGAMNGLG